MDLIDELMSADRFIERALAEFDTIMTRLIGEDIDRARAGRVEGLDGGDEDEVAAYAERLREVRGEARREAYGQLWDAALDHCCVASALVTAIPSTRRDLLEAHAAVRGGLEAAGQLLQASRKRYAAALAENERLRERFIKLGGEPGEIRAFEPTPPLAGDTDALHRALWQAAIRHVKIPEGTT